MSKARAGGNQHFGKKTDGFGSRTELKTKGFPPLKNEEQEQKEGCNSRSVQVGVSRQINQGRTSVENGTCHECLGTVHTMSRSGRTR